MKKYILLGLCIAFVLGISACQKSAPDSVSTEPISAENSDETTETSESPMVPDFTLPANNGEDVSLSDYTGKVVVLNFWASWCAYCKDEMPDFKKLGDEIKDSEEVVLLMLNQTDGQRETKQKADDYLSENGYDFLSLYDSGEVSYSIFGIVNYPTTVVIDGEGRLSDYVIGITDYDTVAEMIEGAK